MNYDILFEKHKESTLFGRHITLVKIEPLLPKSAIIIGKSVLNKPIYKYVFGTGKTRIFIWSQMHGNESTTTKALFDFFNLLHSNHSTALEFKKQFTFCFLPMVNPDGAEKYTRANANDVDLNRDSVQLSQPESNLLRQVFDDFKPNFCFNLHDQRTIFGVANTGKPATVSFLSPSYNKKRTINKTRQIAINVIVAMNDELQKHTPNQVGRFDDGFNINCIGDMFTSLKAPTILIEAGHYPNDYDREITRKMIFIALISGLINIYENDVVSNRIDEYLKIPQNKVVFYDFIYKNVKINYDNTKMFTSFAVQYKEILENSKIKLIGYYAQINNLEHYFAHQTIDAKNKIVKFNLNRMPVLNEIASFSIDQIDEFIDGEKV